MKKTMSQVNAMSLTQRQETLLNKYNAAMTQGRARQAYNAMIELASLDNELQSIYDASMITDTNYIIAQTITYYSLKVLARGRYNPKHTTPDKMYTPCNLLAMDILRKGKYDASGIKEDLTSAVYVKILEYVNNGDITIDGDRITLVNEEDATPIKDILNTVQFELYRHAQRHYKHQYIVQTDEDGNDIDPIMYTMAQRKYDISVESIGADVLINKLHIELTDNERAVLSVKLEKKQVERAYSNNGVSTKRYESRYHTIAEISDITGISVQTVRTCLKAIQRKCTLLLDDMDATPKQVEPKRHDYIMDMIKNFQLA